MEKKLIFLEETSLPYSKDYFLENKCAIFSEKIIT